MAQLALELVEEMYWGDLLGRRFEFPATSANKYCLIQFLQGFKKPSGKQGSSARSRLRTNSRECRILLTYSASASVHFQCTGKCGNNIKIFQGNLLWTKAQKHGIH